MARRATNVTRSRIHAVALPLFLTRGYAATSLQEIATALGVTKAALYYHVPSKTHLLHGLADPFVQAVDSVLAGYGDGPLDAAVRRVLLSRMVDLLLVHQPVVAWLSRDVSALAERGIGERIDGQRERLQRLLAGAETGPVSQVRTAAAVGALLYPFTDLHDRDLRGLHDTVLAAVLGALGTT